MQEMEIDLSMLSNGIYMLQVKAGGKTNSFKLYKE